MLCVLDMVDPLFSLWIKCIKLPWVPGIVLVTGDVTVASQIDKSLAFSQLPRMWGSQG